MIKIAGIAAEGARSTQDLARQYDELQEAYDQQTAYYEGLSAGYQDAIDNMALIGAETERKSQTLAGIVKDLAGLLAETMGPLEETPREKSQIALKKLEDMASLLASGEVEEEEDPAENLEALKRFIREAESLEEVLRLIGPTEEENAAAQARVEELDRLAPLCAFDKPIDLLDGDQRSARAVWNSIIMAQAEFEERYC
jgi:hypothetical protein